MLMLVSCNAVNIGLRIGLPSQIAVYFADFLSIYMPFR